MPTVFWMAENGRRSVFEFFAGVRRFDLRLQRHQKRRGVCSQRSENIAAQAARIARRAIARQRRRIEPAGRNSRSREGVLRRRNSRSREGVLRRRNSRSRSPHCIAMRTAAAARQSRRRRKNKDVFGLTRNFIRRVALCIAKNVAKRHKDPI